MEWKLLQISPKRHSVQTLTVQCNTVLIAASIFNISPHLSFAVSSNISTALGDGKWRDDRGGGP